MAILDDIADGLAREALSLADELGREEIVEEVAKLIGTSSPTVEEAFRTAVRMRRAERRAQKLMAQIRERGTPARAALTPPAQESGENLTGQ